MKSKKINKLKDIQIYIEAIVYGLLMIVTIFASMYAPLEVKLIPLVFLLGIIGRIIFDRPIVTSLLGFCISLCEIEIIGDYSFKSNFVFSSYNFLCILLGEMTGYYILNIFYSNSKKLTVKMVHSISMSIIAIFFAIFFNQYLNGNAFSYITARKLALNYVYERYSNNSENIKIVHSKHIPGSSNYYEFTFSNLNESKPSDTYIISIYSSEKIIDGYFEEYLKEKSKVLNSKFKYKYLSKQFEDLSINLRYIDEMDNIVLNVTKDIDEISNKKIEEFCYEIYNMLDIINDFDEFNNIIKIQAILKSQNEVASGEINKIEFSNIQNYISSFDIEFLEI